MTTTDPLFSNWLRMLRFLYDAEMCRVNAITCIGTQLDRQFYLRRQRIFTYLAKRRARMMPQVYTLYPELKEA